MRIEKIHAELEKMKLLMDKNQPYQEEQAVQATLHDLHRYVPPDILTQVAFLLASASWKESVTNATRNMVGSLRLPSSTQSSR